MDAKVIKRHLYLTDNIETVLKDIGMKHINSSNQKYITCCMPDGDNKTSTIVYKEEEVGVKAHTRDIGGTDIISLVCYIKGLYISNAIKYMCDLVGLNYYGQDLKIPKSIRWLNYMCEIKECDVEIEEETLESVDESYLNKFYRCSNGLFYEDGISDMAQFEFETMLCMESSNIIIPIRDELGSLVGIKARKFTRENVDNKYYYVKPFPKTKILYGLNKTYDFIKEKNEVIVFESEKSVMKAWGLGLKNTVAISGHSISKHQAKKLSHLGVNIILCFDKDIGKNEVGDFDEEFYKKECKKFFENQPVDVMFDFDNLLKEKDSPIDNPKAFKKIYKRKVKIQ